MNDDNAETGGRVCETNLFWFTEVECLVCMHCVYVCS